MVKQPTDGMPDREHPVTEADVTAYAYGWLSGPEAARVCEAIAHDPQLAELFDRAVRVKQLLDEDADVEPPARLIDRTIASVYLRSAAERCYRTVPLGPCRYRFRLVDLAVAAVLAVVMSTLLLPAVTHFREHQRQVACRENLRAIGVALSVYGDQFNGQLPQVSWAEGLGPPAAIQPATLVEYGYLPDAASLHCPGDTRRRPVRPLTVAELEVLRQQGAAEALRGALRQTAGSYAFSTGYFIEGAYWGPRLNVGTNQQLLVVDRPAEDITGGWLTDRNSQNHSGRGQNALYADLHVGFLVRPEALATGDAIYANRAQRIGAALSWDDVAMAAGDVLPEGPLATVRTRRDVF